MSHSFPGAMQIALDEILANLLKEADVDLAPWVVVEYYLRIPKEVFAYQFFRPLQEDRLLKNIATWIPDMVFLYNGNRARIQMQQKGGHTYHDRPWTKEKMDITAQLCINFRNSFAASPLLVNLQAPESRNTPSDDQSHQLQLSSIRDMIQEKGVLATMRTLSESIQNSADVDGEAKVEHPHA